MTGTHRPSQRRSPHPGPAEPAPTAADLRQPPHPDEELRQLEDRLHRELLVQPDEPGPADVERLIRSAAPLLGATARTDLSRALLARIRGLGPLDPLLDDLAVTDVMVNGPGVVWVERAGVVEPTDIVVDQRMAEHLVERVVSPLGLQADRRHPLVDARLPDGSRVHVAMPPLAVDGPYLTIRRFRAETLTLDAFADPPVAALLAAAVRDRRNLVVSGATGAGKTTLLNALCAHLPRQDRIVTVEDAAELRIPGDHVVRLESRPATPDGIGETTIRTLVRNALRMRPDRIVVGEVRGAEALDMLQALNTGHDGSLSTCHANGPDDAIRRLETMALTAGVDLPLIALRDQLRHAVDAIIHVARDVDGARRVDAVGEVLVRDGQTRTQPVVQRGQVVGQFQRPARRRGER